MNMIKSQIFSKSLLFAVAFFFIVLSQDTSAQTTIISSPYSTTVNLRTPILATPTINCVDLVYDLYQGLSDSGLDSSIMKLQKYLVVKGYLLATPNGYFGPGTLSAVKKFQVANGISNTGRVGPATRKAIKNNSCIVSNTASAINSLPIAKPSTNITRINTSNLTVISPQASSTLNTDSTTRIQWQNVPSSIYSISLEDINGVGAGHITQSVSGDYYEWKAGKVFSARTNSDIYVSPGIYRIKLTNSGFNSTSVPDQYSGLFTILAKPISIKSILPNTVANTETATVVLYGSGFDSTTRVYLDIQNSNRNIKPYFISDDGKVLLFNVIQHSYAGQYFISVINTFENGATSTPSNPVSLIITN